MTPPIIAEWVLLVLWARVLAMAALPWLREQRSRNVAGMQSSDPTVSIVVPAFNEASQIAATLDALAQLSPPPFEVLVVNDGSSDDTSALAKTRLERFKNGRLIEWTNNRGKVAALNAGFAAARGDIIATIDADTRVWPDSILEGTAYLLSEQADAVAAEIDVENPSTLLQRLQQQEYQASLNFERRAQAAIHTIAVLPGAASLFRRELLSRVPYSSRTVTEDADFTLTATAHSARIGLAPRFRANTDTPNTWLSLVRQRIRWTTGHIQCCFFHAPSIIRPWRSRTFFSFTNFFVATMAPALFAFALLALSLTAQSPRFGLTAWSASGVSALVVYVQRMSATAFEGKHSARSLVMFVVEPIASSIIAGISFWCAVVALLWKAMARVSPQLRM